MKQQLPGVDVPSEQERRSLTFRLMVVGAAVVGAVAIAFLSIPKGDVRTTFGDLTQLVLSSTAAVCAGLAARRSVGRLRTTWLWMTVGVGGWAVGQLIWSYYELVLDEPPFPSWADAGFLIFPVGVAIALWVFPTYQPPGIRLRNVLDGIVIVGALAAISWALVLEQIFENGKDPDSGTFGLVVSVAYPVGDVLFIAMMIYGLTRPGPFRRIQILLAVAMAAMAASDTPFVYLTANGDYETGTPWDLGWVVAFLLVAITATVGAENRLPEPPSAQHPPDAPIVLAYLPLLLAGVVVVVVEARRQDSSMLGEAICLAISVGAVLGRQYITVHENRRLMTVIASREDQLRRQATMDLLTGLTNRALFNDRVSHALELHRRDLRPLAIMFCDLDDFKVVNDTFGHPAGDELLIRVSDRLRGALRTGDTLARFGGDEFAILIEDGGESAAVGARIVEAMQPPFTISGSQLSIRMSVGMIELGADEPSPTMEVLLSHADIAMYSAKRAGKGQLALYEPSMMAAGVLELPLQRPLAAAVASGGIDVAYQPVVSLTDNIVVGVEALARWRHDGVDIPPSQFIPLAVRSGLIGALTNVMLEHACADLARWSRRLGHQNMRVAVNVPPGLITDPGFPTQMAEVIGRYEIKPDQIVLEITEDALLGEIPTARVVTRKLNALGVVLALDDFGTGYSSLLHLQQIPLRILKIDMGFVADIDLDPRAERLMHALLGLGRDLGLDIVAEGVERQSQADLLRSMGCPFAQGHYFAKAGPASGVVDAVERLAAVRTPGREPVTF